MRTARLHVPGALHHLIWRFVDRDWFIESSAERARYLWLLGRALEPSDWRCVAYAVMSSHIHIAAVAGEEPLSHWSRRVNSPFANWMNEQRHRLGPLFADRARDYALGPIAASEVIAYIHNNPVRARVVKRARDSSWTSARAYLKLSARPRWLDVAAGLAFSGMNARELEERTAAMPSDPELADLKRIAKAAKTRGSIHVATPVGRSVPLVIRPYGRVFADPQVLVTLVARVTGIPAPIVASLRRDPRSVRARIVAVHAGKHLGLTGAAIAAALGVSEQSVSKIARYTEMPPEAGAVCAAAGAGQVE
jgi:hypothetical protein